MLRRFFGVLLACSLMLPEALLAQQAATRTVAANQPAAPPAPQSSSPGQTAQSPPESVRPQSQEQRRSYERETKPRRRSHHISKGEVAFMAGIAGTSMGIGAIAGGGVGLAVGAIVGGWGAYIGHRVWHWVK